MTDKEKVIFQLSETYKVLEIVTPHFNQIMDYEGMIQGCKDAIAMLKEQEAVIRCKDCKHYNNFSVCRKFLITGGGDDWYCADGERRIDDD